MDEIVKATKNYPRFSDGRINYKDQRVCYVVSTVVIADDYVLLLERSKDVSSYPETINGVSGFIDQLDLTLEDIVKKELKEEVKAPLEKIQNIKIGEQIIQTDEDIGKEWRVYPVTVQFKEKFKPKINWENKSAKWYKTSDAQNLKLMPGFGEVLEYALKMR